MKVTIDNNEKQKSINPNILESYLSFRTAIPKPSNEEVHLRHILRFYIARSLFKMNIMDIYILPKIQVNGQTLVVDVVGIQQPNKYYLAICEADSITEKTENLLELLKEADDCEIIVLHSQYGNQGNVPEKYKEQIKNKKIKLMAIVPPPFDDVYEYDIWMFETTFRNTWGE